MSPITHHLIERPQESHVSPVFENATHTTTWQKIFQPWQLYSTTFNVNQLQNLKQVISTQEEGPDPTKSNERPVQDQQIFSTLYLKSRDYAKLFSQLTAHGAQTSAWSPQPCQVSSPGPDSNWTPITNKFGKWGFEHSRSRDCHGLSLSLIEIGPSTKLRSLPGQH